MISKAKYFQSTVKPFVSNYISGSPEALTSFFNNSKLSLTELEEIRQMIDERIKKMKKTSK